MPILLALRYKYAKTGTLNLRDIPNSSIDTAVLYGDCVFMAETINSISSEISAPSGDILTLLNDIDAGSIAVHNFDAALEKVAGVIAGERYTGLPLERETIATVTVSWKNLKTGEILINNEQVSASSTYSSQLGQSFDYGADVAVNRAAEKVVELMERRL